MTKRRSAQDVARASRLKDFRSKLAKAKRLGVVSAKIDARSQKRTRHFVRKLRDLEPVLEGRYAAVKASPKIVREFRSAGARTINGRILVEARPEVITSVRKGDITEGIIMHRAPLGGGFFEEEIVFPVSSHNVADMLDYMERHKTYFNNRKNRTEQFGFKIEGYRSYETYGDIDNLVMRLRNYPEAANILETSLADHPKFLTIYRVIQPQWTYATGNARVERQKEHERQYRIDKAARERARRLANGEPLRFVGKTQAERQAIYRKSGDVEAKKAKDRARKAAQRKGKSNGKS